VWVTIQAGEKLQSETRLSRLNPGEGATGIHWIRHGLDDIVTRFLIVLILPAALCTWVCLSV
jgi:hypothetical protein